MPLTGSRPPARSDFANRTVEIPDDRNSEDRSRWFVYGLATCADEDRRENQTGVLPRSCRPAPEMPNPSFWYRLSLGAPDLSCGPRVNQSSNREPSIDSNRFMLWQVADSRALRELAPSNSSTGFRPGLGLTHVFSRLVSWPLPVPTLQAKRSARPGCRPGRCKMPLALVASVRMLKRVRLV